MQYRWSSTHKYYHLYIQQTLFGNTDIVCSWGSFYNNLGNFKIITCDSTEALDHTFKAILQRRKSRGYELY